MEWGAASRVHAVEMSYLRGACGVSRWDGLSNESVYERCSMSEDSGESNKVKPWGRRKESRQHNMC